MPGEDVIARLIAMIKERRSSTGDTSYTRRLLDKGAPYCARKLGEEAIELVLAGACEDETALKGEAADVIYHLLVLLEARHVNFADVLSLLEGRMAQSGLQEKAARTLPP